MGLTKSERHNRMMDGIFERYHQNRKDPAIKSFRKHQVKIGEAYKDKGDMYPSAKNKAIHAKSEKK